MDPDTAFDAAYAPGGWVAIAGPAAWLLVDLPATDPIVLQSWHLVSAGAGVEELLDVLVVGGIGSAPSFALVRDAAEAFRVVVRGAASVRVGGAEPYDITAPAGISWIDQLLQRSAPDITLRGDRAADAVVELPLSAGVSMAAVVRIGAGMPRQAPPAHRPEPARPLSVPVAPEPVEPPSYDFLFGETQHPPVIADEPAAPPAPDEGHTVGWWTSDAPGGSPEQAADPSVEPLRAGGLIDGVPWLSAEPAAPPSPVVSPAAPAASVGVEQTTNRAALTEAAALLGPTVLAAYCPDGHLTPVHAAQCRVCGVPTQHQAGFEVARPVLGTLHFSTGDSVPLDRGVILGRAPDVPIAGSAEQPNVMRLASPENDISRNHAEVVLDGWNVYVRDLGSTNGTVITLPGRPPVRLRPDDLHPIEAGTVVSLADEVTFEFRVRA